MQIENQSLFESISVQVQTALKINPLAANIFSYLYLDFEDKGVTFKELCTFFNASKSSVSTSIQLLLQLKMIEYKYKIKSRQRLFRHNRTNYMELRLSSLLDFLKKEKDIQQKVNQLYKKKNVGNERLLKTKIYLKHLNKSILNIEETLLEVKNVKKDTV